MLDFTYEELMELKYDARHGDEYSMWVLDEYYDQFDVPPTEEEIAQWEKQDYENEVMWWIEQFSEQNDYYGEDGRYNYPYCEF